MNPEKKQREETSFDYEAEQLANHDCLSEIRLLINTWNTEYCMNVASM